MENKDIEARKEKIISFIKQKKGWIQYFLLAFILWLAYYIRSQNWELLKDATTGKYISLEIDSALFMRYAQYIAEHGKLFAVDVLRNYPFGVDIDFGVFTSYFVAYLYKVLYVFNSSITIELADVVYPTVATIIAALFLFLFVRRLFDYRVALLSSLFLVVLPSFLFRSISSDHDILGLMFIFMTLYFFVVGWQSKRRRYNILFGALAAFTSILGYSTAGNMAIFFMIVGLFTLIHILLDNVKKSDVYVYPTWYLLTFSVLLILGEMDVSRFLTDYTSSIPATIAFLSLLVYKFLDYEKIKNHKLYNKILTKVPQGFIAFISVAIFSFLFLIIFFGPAYVAAMFRGFIGIFTHAFVGNRWASTVAENRRIFVIDWFSTFGSLIVLLFITGFILVIYRLVKNLKDYKKLFFIYSICVVAFIFSKYSENSILNGKSLLSNIMFYGSIIAIVTYTVYYYIKNYYEAGKSSNRFTIELDWKYTFILVIAIVNVVGGTSAVRYFFELSPFIIILSSFALVVVLDYFLSFNTKFLKYAGVVFLILLLFSPFSFAKGVVIKDAESSYNQVKYSGPSYSRQWQLAGQWVRDNTSKDAVFNHWWDYGYWVQGGFERATVTDGGNRIGWWNFLTARNVLTAPNDSDALGFLYSHNVSYLLIVGEELGKYPAYGLIGSDHKLDRYSYVTFFGLDNSLTQDTRNGTALVYTGSYGLDEDFVFNGQVYPAGSAVAGVIINLKKVSDENGTLLYHTVENARMILVAKNQQLDLKMRCVYVDKLYTFDDYDYGGCAKVIPTIKDNNMNNVGAIAFMSRRVAGSLVGRLYIMDQDSEYFKLAYTDQASIPVAIYNDRQIGPIKIWKVEYPEGFSVNETDYEYYTRTEYPDLTLTEF